MFKKILNILKRFFKKILSQKKNFFEKPSFEIF